MAAPATWVRTSHDTADAAQADLPLGDADWLADAVEEPARPRRWKEAALAGAMILLAAAWIAAVAMVAGGSPGGLQPGRAAAWIGVACGPLTLLALLALILMRTGRAEATAYGRAARDLRLESRRLAELLTLVDRRIATARQGLAKHGAEIARLGEETGERLGRAGEALRADADHVAATAARLDDATATARTDMGVLLGDLPTLEAHAATLSAHLRAIGRDAEANGTALADGLSAIEAQARAADQASVAAARRLAIELERIEGSAAAADRRIADAATRLGEAADEALAGTAGALDQVRRGVDQHGAAIAAIVAQAADALDRKGDEGQRALAGRLAELALRIDEAAGRLGGHEAAARGFIGQLDQALGGIERRFEGLGDKGAEHVADLAETLAALAEHGEQIGRVLGQNGQSAAAALGRVTELRAQAEAASATIGEDLPAMLARARAQADEALAGLDAVAPRAADLVATVDLLQGKLAEAGALVEIGGERSGRALEQADERLAALTRQIEALDDLARRTGEEIGTLSEGASVRLVDALLRVRETATQAAAHARETLEAAIPRVAQTLGEASAAAMTTALADVGRGEIAAVRTASEEAADAARAASERLNRQLIALTETTRAVEARIAEQQAAHAETDEAGFAQQVSLLIEALNSTAIDVTRVLAAAPADTEWAAYLKGDRGIFTRRAVRLLDGGDARAIATRYTDDAEFRDRVNRYIHDFEAMLRRVLAVRDGNVMGVTMLSSDMGKLYVALAQAIDRLRR